MTAGSADGLAEAYAHCLTIARAHYENFPVASRAVPRRLRKHVAAVYAFARTADDFADEGSRGGEERLHLLGEWRGALEASMRGGTPGDPIFAALGDTIRRFAVPPELFHLLLDAFEQDVRTHSYETFADLLAYCTRSADPVGRIVLALFGRLDERTAVPSDALCTALQLANFWQDVSVDREIPRCYIPAEDFRRFGLEPGAEREPRASSAFRALVRFEVERTREYFLRAYPLFAMLPFRLSLELRAVHAGGRTVLDRIASAGYDVLAVRPALGLRAAPRLAYNLLRPRT